MKHNFIYLLFVFSLSMHAQNSIVFKYDSAGNQTQRNFIFGAESKGSSVPPKEIVALEEEDLQKFFPEDVISYYPNPVREELYLKWVLNNENYVKSLQVYNFNGQILKSYSQSGSSNEQIIPFQAYSTGTYLIVLEYSDGDQKTIKIIKQ
jgi:hypothetical protein